MRQISKGFCNRSIAVALACILMFAGVLTNSASAHTVGETFALVHSLTSDRAGAAQLDGATLSGNSYIFVTPQFPTSQISEVNFYIDDPSLTNLTKRERLAPYDLAGGSSSKATGFRTLALANGAHSLDVVISFVDGHPDVHLSAAFLISNSPAEPLNLGYSLTSSRVDPLALSGATLTGSAFVFITPELPLDDIAEVNFYIDEPSLTISTKRERRAPYDLAGGPTNAANAFDTATLVDGAHNITAVVTFADGQPDAIFSADITIDNSGGGAVGPVAFEFGFSLESDRSFNAGLIPNPLEIEALAGSVFLFLADAADCTAGGCPPLASSIGIDKVDFFLDDELQALAPFTTELTPTYDFAGDDAVDPTLAAPLNLDLIAPVPGAIPLGLHTITAVISRTDGTTSVLSRQFIAVPLDAIIPKSLKGVPIPEDPNIMSYVKNREAAILLGKALFWDQQAGSSGDVACANCHYKAGADNRILNTVNPMAGGAFDVVAAAGEQLTLAAFPFHKVTPPLAPFGALDRSHDDVVGSQGVVKKDFAGLSGTGVDNSSGPASPESVFLDSFGTPQLQVTGRNTPTNINAIFNVRSFWDGRANFVFNGINPFGARDSGAMVFGNDGAMGDVPIPEAVRLRFSSLASQAVGPPLSGVEMSWAMRSFPALGQKMLGLRPLQQQLVHPNDSQFGTLGPMGNLVDASGLGLTTTYSDLIEMAFHDRLWNGGDVSVDGTVFTQKAANFSLFWGLAIQMWEATLVSDDSRFDQMRDGGLAALNAALNGEPSAILNPQETEGMLLFVRQGACVFCHGGPVFSAATVPFLQVVAVAPEAPEQIIERMLMEIGIGALIAGDPNPPAAVYDLGFYNIGIRPTAEDIGIGGTDPFINPLTGATTPLSFSRQLTGPPGTLVDDLSQTPLTVDPCLFFVDTCANVAPGERVAVDGAFKVPTLRNIEFTGPYFHNGGMATLEETVQFYARGADFRFANIANLDPEVFGVLELQVFPARVDAIVAFLKTLTDDRVRTEAAPFDHPELPLPNGDLIAAVGADGGPPLISFGDKLAALAPPPPVGEVFGIDVSLSPDRSAGTALDGATVSGNAYIYLTPTFPTSGISEVNFYLDDPTLTVLEHRERRAPYDIAGGSTSSATGFNTLTLGNGIHNLTVVVSFTDGSADVVLSADFTVDNGIVVPEVIDIAVSLSPDRTSPVPLDGSTISGSVYISLTPEYPVTNISEVNFYLDDPTLTIVTKRERRAPYDLAGGPTSAATAFDANTLTPGSHVLVAIVSLSNGTTVSITANFTH